MAKISITHQTGDQFQIDIRGHELTVDQPRHGAETGPSPTELFVASLAACVGHYAVRFLRANQVPCDGLRIGCEWTMLAARPPRVGRIRIEVSAPVPVPPELRDGLRDAMDACLVHNSLRRPPEVVIGLRSRAGPVPADGVGR